MKCKLFRKGKNWNRKTPRQQEEQQRNFKKVTKEVTEAVVRMCTVKNLFLKFR